jgi:hypothetical protein
VRLDFFWVCGSSLSSAINFALAVFLSLVAAARSLFDLAGCVFLSQ